MNCTPAGTNHLLPKNKTMLLRLGFRAEQATMLSESNANLGQRPVRLVGGWLLVLFCSERKIQLGLVADLFREKSRVGQWLISQTNRANVNVRGEV
jgi:hypothetical protein